jgi:hypothetical protein
VTTASRKSDLITDEANVYTRLGQEFASHQTVNHSKYEYARGPVSTNTVEGFFSIFKRGMTGVYQHCSEAPSLILTSIYSRIDTVGRAISP